MCERREKKLLLFVTNHMVSFKVLSEALYRVVAVFCSCRTASCLAYWEENKIGQKRESRRKNVSSSSPSDVSYVADIALHHSALKNTVFLPGSERCSARGDWRRTWNADGLGALHADAHRRKVTE